MASWLSFRVLACLFLLSTLSVPHSVRADPSSDFQVIEDFSRYDLGDFPKWWKTWPFHRGKAKQVYRVAQEGEKFFLAAKPDPALSEQIYHGFYWDADSFPYLNWRWRAHVLPKGAAENDPQTNDSACGVYIVFGRTSGTSLKFVWSSTLKTGTVFEKKPGEVVFQVLDSGTQYLNQWRGHSIPVAQVFETLLKRKMDREPTGFAVLTDGNATRTASACDYADFTISKTPKY